MKQETGDYRFLGVLICDVKIHYTQQNKVVVSDVELPILDDEYGHISVRLVKKSEQSYVSIHFSPRLPKKHHIPLYPLNNKTNKNGEERSVSSQFRPYMKCHLKDILLCSTKKSSDMNIKKEGAYYSQMVRRYKNEYGGKNLQEFCIKEKMSYTKMLHCLRNESYRKPMEECPSQTNLSYGLHPLVIDKPKNDSHSDQDIPASVSPVLAQSAKLEDVNLTISSKIELRLKNCDIKTLVVLIKEMEAALC